MKERGSGGIGWKGRKGEVEGICSGGSGDGLQGMKKRNEGGEREWEDEQGVVGKGKLGRGRGVGSEVD